MPSTITALLQHEAAYIAGIMDGEGCISIHRKKNVRGTSPTFALFVNVTNTERKLLEWIQAKVGAGVITPKPKSNSNWKLCHQLVFRTEEIESFLKAVLPYMIVRETQAKLMLEFLTIEWKQTGDQKTKPSAVRIEQELIQEEIEVLNKRGQ